MNTDPILTCKKRGRELTEKAKIMSILSMVLIIIFGLILITDNFHVVSDMIYPFLRLS